MVHEYFIDRGILPRPGKFLQVVYQVGRAIRARIDIHELRALIVAAAQIQSHPARSKPCWLTKINRYPDDPSFTPAPQIESEFALDAAGRLLKFSLMFAICSYCIETKFGAVF